MKRSLAVFRLLAGLCLLTVATSAAAILPDSGWYWNPAESGRGFNIEIQNNVFFMAGFVYDSNGNAIWLTTGGPMSSDHTYSGDVYQTAGGQCLGCSYSGRPQVTKFGTASVTFTDSETALITLNGTTISVQREQFGFDFSNPATPLLGEWATTEGSLALPVYFGERITLSYTQESTSTGLFAAGSRSGDPVRLAVGSYLPGTGEWTVLLDSSDSYYKLYLFTFVGFNRIEGTVSVYLKGTSPNGSMDFVAQRTESGALVGGANAPGLKKAARAGTPSSANEVDAAEAKSQSTAGRSLPALLKAAALLEPMLRR